MDNSQTWYCKNWPLCTICRNLWACDQRKGLQRCGPKVRPGSHISCSWEVESMGEYENWISTLPNELPLWELEFRWTLKFLERNCRGQNPLDYEVSYIIGKLLELRCLKLARTTHLDIWNTSYGQKKGRKSNCQIWFPTIKSLESPWFPCV